MAVEWGLRQTATIGKSWISIPIEETVTIEPNVIYQFDYTVPEVKWWHIFRLWRDFNPEKFVISFREEIAEKAGILPEEIKVVWQKFSPEARTFQLQVIYLPSTVPAQGGLPIGLGILTTIMIIGAIAVAFNISLGWLAEKLGIDITPTLQEIKKLVAEVGKGLPWIAIPVSILGIGWVTSMVLKKKGG